MPGARCWPPGHVPARRHADDRRRLRLRFGATILVEGVPHGIAAGPMGLIVV